MHALKNESRFGSKRTAIRLTFPDVWLQRGFEHDGYIYTI
jgi:hypothetical protein